MAGKAKAASKKIQRVDRKVARASGRQRNSGLVKTLGALSEFGDQPPMIALGVATLAAGAVLRDGNIVRTGVRMLAAHWLATGAKSFIKHRIDRRRPHAVMDGEPYAAQRGHSHQPVLNSFPSGHTAGATAVAAAIARDNPRAAPLAYGIAAGIATVQMPRGQHYASDIVVGAVIGRVSEWLASKAMAMTEPRLRDMWEQVAHDPADRAARAKVSAVDASTGPPI